MPLDQMSYIHPPRDWIDTLQALLTPVVAFLASIIGTAQWWTARNKFKLDLFDRRWAIWEETCKIISAMFSYANTTQEDKDRFLKGIRGAKWLLNNRIDTYLKKELWPKICELEAANAMFVEHAPPIEREKAAAKKTEIMNWTVKQYDVVDGLFCGFLQMDMPFTSWLCSWVRRRN